MYGYVYLWGKKHPPIIDHTMMIMMMIIWKALSKLWPKEFTPNKNLQPNFSKTKAEMSFL